MRKPEVIEEGILPCPFCGNTKLKVDSKHNGHWSNVGTHSATVRCSKCHARGPTASCKVSDSRWEADDATKQKAIELWNARIAESKPVETGAWIDVSDSSDVWTVDGKQVFPKFCSNCGDVYSKPYRYCPTCGSKMNVEK